jgi:hypothetical protein
MKTNELRIGNLINALYDDDEGFPIWETVEIHGLDSVGFSEHDIWCNGESHSEFYADFEPIRLTEEWLLKFGFIKKNKSFHKKDKLDIWHTVIEMRKHCYYYKGFRMMNVHNFQNLYFALTGNELEIK